MPEGLGTVMGLPVAIDHIEEKRQSHNDQKQVRPTQFSYLPCHRLFYLPISYVNSQGDQKQGRSDSDNQIEERKRLPGERPYHQERKGNLSAIVEELSQVLSNFFLHENDLIKTGEICQ